MWPVRHQTIALSNEVFPAPFIPSMSVTGLPNSNVKSSGGSWGGAVAMNACKAMGPHRFQMYYAPLLPVRRGCGRRQLGRFLCELVGKRLHVYLLYVPSPFVTVFSVSVEDRSRLGRIEPEFFTATIDEYSTAAHQLVAQCFESVNVERCRFGGVVHGCCLRVRWSLAARGARAKRSLRGCHGRVVVAQALVQMGGSIRRLVCPLRCTPCFAHPPG